MMTNEQIARVAHDVNRGYYKSQGDYSQLPWGNTPQWQKESETVYVTFYKEHRDATPEEAHAHWLALKIAEGWRYGPSEDEAKKENPGMVPYDQLPPERRPMGYLFKAVVDSLKNFPS